MNKVKFTRAGLEPATSRAVYGFMTSDWRPQTKIFTK